MNIFNLFGSLLGFAQEILSTLIPIGVVFIIVYQCKSAFKKKPEYKDCNALEEKPDSDIYANNDFYQTPFVIL